jgi:hypothetical protein
VDLPDVKRAGAEYLFPEPAAHGTVTDDDRSGLCETAALSG